MSRRRLPGCGAAGPASLVLLALLALLAAGVWGPAALPVSASSPAADPEALMRALEERFRSQARVLRLTVTTIREEPRPGLPAHEVVGLWGVLGGEPERTELLFVFTEPRRMRGTGLWIEDRRGPDGEDAMAYHMRTFDRFKAIPTSSLKLLVPGTCLTYEDARGFLSTDKYDFSPEVSSRVPPDDASGHGRVRLRARPKTPELARDLGVDELRVAVDPERLLVERVDVLGPGGEPLKTYRIETVQRLGELWLAETAAVTDLQSRVISHIAYQRWPLAEPPAAELFELRVDSQPLLDRILAALRDWGIVGPERSPPPKSLLKFVPQPPSPRRLP